MAFVACWDSLDDSHWTASNSDSIEVPQWLSGEHLSRFSEQLSVCRRVRCVHELKYPEWRHSLCTALAKASQLEVLDLRDLELDSLACDALADSLRHTTRLQQLHMRVNGKMSDASIAKLVASIGSLAQLKALSLRLYAPRDTNALLMLANAVERVSKTLVSFELRSVNSVASALPQLLLALQRCSHLQILRLRMNLCAAALDVLCKLMQSTVSLRVLSVLFAPPANLDVLSAALETFRGRLFEVYLGFPTNLPTDSFTRLLSALKDNHVSRITIDIPEGNEIPEAAINKSGLVRAGWVQELEFEAGYNIIPAPKWLTVDLKRNKVRRAHCRAACIALLAARKYRHVLPWIANEIVVSTACNIWETRNQKEWEC